MPKLSQPIYRTLLAFALLFLVVFGIYHIFRKLIDPKMVWELLKHFSPRIFFFLLVVSSLMMISRSYRLFILLRNAHIKVSFWQTLKVYLAGQALSPLPGGEGSRTAFLKIESRADFKEMATPLILLGMSEMLIAAIIALVGSVVYGILRGIAFISLIGTLCLILLLINYKVVRAVADLLPRHKKIKKAEEAIVSTQKEVGDAIFDESLTPSVLLYYLLALALLTDVLGGLIIFALGRYYHLDLTFFRSLYVFAAATVLGELVQFIPGGVGVTEGGLTGILVLSGIDVSPALAMVLIFRVVTLLYGIIVGLIFLMLFYLKPYFKSGIK